MTLKEIFEQEKAKPTPIKSFIDEVCRVTDKQQVTVYRWLNGTAQPDKLTKRILADHFKTTPEDLFAHIK